MNRLRAQLACLGPAVAALFALSVAAPRAGFLYHEHAGGDRTHVHADSDSAIAELLDEYLHQQEHAHGLEHTHPAPHHDSPTAADPSHPASAHAALAHDDGPTTGHWHQQDRFHRAVVSGAPFITAVAPTGLAPQHAPALATHLAALDLRARGPPHAPLS